MRHIILPSLLGVQWTAHNSILYLGHLDELDSHPAQLFVAAVDQLGYFRLAKVALDRLLYLVARPIVNGDLRILTGHESASVLFN